MDCHVDLLCQLLMHAIIGVCHSQRQCHKHISHIMQELRELPAHLALLHANRQRKVLLNGWTDKQHCVMQHFLYCVL